MPGTPMPIRPAPAPALSKAASGWLGIAALLLVVALVYWPGLRGGFVFDDYPNIIENTALHVGWESGWRDWLAAAFSSPASAMQRPLASLTFAINHAATGLDPYWMKATNLGIHLLNALLVFVLCRLLLRAIRPGMGTDARDARIALWIAAAWALNPINLMAVLFVVQRMESLCHTFVFAGLAMYLAGRLRLQAGHGGWALVLGGLLGGTALGVLAKESAALLPVYALAIEWALLWFGTDRGRPDRRLLALFACIVVLPAVVGLWWMVPQVLGNGVYATRDFDLGERLLTEGRVLVDYLRWTLLPNLGQLSLYHDDYVVSRGLLQPPSTLVALLMLAGLAAAAAWLRTRRPLMALGLAWFLCAHLLTATIWPLELVYEHRNYFASLGLCLVLADVLLRLAGDSDRFRRIGVLLAMVLLLLYAGTTALRALEWSNPLRFAMSEAAKHPQSPRATYDLARDYILLSGFDPASPYVDEAFAALERARQVPRATPLPESAAILLAARTGRGIDPDWWRGLERKLAAGPIGAEGHNALGTLAKCVPVNQCELPLAPVVAVFENALARQRHPETLSIYGNYALNGLRDPNLALRLWQEAAERAPHVVQYQETLARMLIASGRPDLAAAPIARLRNLGQLGQNEALARELERLAQERSPVAPEGQQPGPGP